MRARFALWTLLAALAVGSAVAAGGGVPAAVASGAASAPLQVASASVTQSGQDLTWTVQTAAPLRPAALARQHRSLCLLLERRRGGAWGELCLAGSARGRPRLTFAAVRRAGVARSVAVGAVFVRHGPGTLSASFQPSAFGMAYRDFRWQVRSGVRARGCTPPGRVAGECVVLFPAGHGVLARIHTPQLVGCVPRGSAFVNSGPSTGRKIALTFDDGPWYDTPRFLTVLERYHVPATFFEIGRQISGFGQGGAVERRMLADGDMIGDHTWSHLDVAAGGELARQQIVATAQAIRTATHGFYPCLFRAPYGATSPALIALVRSLGMTAIQWDVDPRDWALPGVSAIYDNVVAGAHPGAIILQHDGGGDRSQTLAALPMEIQALERRGYRFVTVTQLLGMRLVYR